ncbi:XkdQ/YqbQ family protein [Anaeromassilibacillus senegalensis]|uniref:XkdQ/YqbQ family protein n=1 Tax=Anaeromassilibacillus senegalensis TaxID=1673717 RepID=UPI00068261BE|nr:hypothetical protein [Anaeromassilibacillus senegalensis]
MITITLQNSSGVYDITTLVPTVTWSGNYKQCTRTLSFELLSSPIDKSVPSVSIENGNYVTLLQDSTTLFTGIVFSLQKSSEGNTIKVTAYDRGIYLKSNKVVKKYTGQAPESIVRSICSEHGITAGDIATTGVPITRNFIGVSLYDIIQTAYTLAAAKTKKKYHLVFDAEKLCVLEKKVNDKTLVLEGGSNLIDISTTNSIDSMVNQVAIYDKNDKLIRTIKNDDTIRLYGLMQSQVKQKDGEDATAEAQKLLDDNGLQQKITVNNLGNIANVTGGTVVVHEPHTGVYGLFYIDEDTHEWKKGLYLNKLVLNFKNIMDEREAGSLPNKTGSKTAGKKKNRQIVHLNLGKKE